MIAKYWNNTTMPLIFGAVLIGAGLIGFVPNGVAGPGAFFEANIPHNLVHIVTGLLAILLAAAGGGRYALWGLSMFYVGFCAIGFLSPGPFICSIVKINNADNFLHAALTASFVVTAALLSLNRDPMGRSMTSLA